MRIKDRQRRGEGDEGKGEERGRGMRIKDRQRRGEGRGEWVLFCSTLVDLDLCVIQHIQETV